MPYRIDLPCPPPEAADRLIDLGALDVEIIGEAVAAILPDALALDTVSAVLGGLTLTVSPAVGRDDGSVWVLGPRTVRLGAIELAPSGAPSAPGRIRLADGKAFGTGLHPTTALCLEAVADACASGPPEGMLDVGTGSGVLALAALTLGVPRVLGLDIDANALTVAQENARLNGLDQRLRLVFGGPETVDGTWPFVVANVLAAPLIEMAPVLVRRVGHRGRLILSGIPQGVAPNVEQAYVRLGMQAGGTVTRAGWVALTLRATW